MSPPALKVRNLCVEAIHPTGGLPVVDQVGFDLAKGEVLALVGESGCGKTKTAEAIMGLLPSSHWNVSADAVELNGLALSRLPQSALRKQRGKEISMVFQEPLTALDPVFSCGSQLCSIIRRHLGVPKREVRERAINMLEQVGFADPVRVYKSYPHQLSGGMRQRVMIAMAMCCQPAVMIADEPTTALDVTTQAQVLEQLTRLGQQYNTAILLITHDLGVVAQYADRVLVMLDGKVVEASTVQDIFSQPHHPCTRELLSFARGKVS